jgi:hypothetical protein
MTVDLLVFGLGLLVWRSAVAVRVGDDARHHGLPLRKAAGWAALALLAADRWWWGGRLEVLSADEARALLRSTAQAHRLTSVVNVRCPLCDAEIVDALTVTDEGRLAIRPKAQCRRCDFRLDACRHCAHFLPAQVGFSMTTGESDFSHGRCGQYRALQPVREAYPQQARQLEARGYDMLPAPKPITDSYIPLEECTAFELKMDRLRASRVAWLTRQRIALVQLRDMQSGSAV